MSISYATAKSIIRIFHVITRQDCHTFGKLDYPTGAKIIAGNHPNATDGLFLPFIFAEHLHFFVQGDIFDIPFVGWLLAKADQIKVIPGQKHQALDQGIQLLENNQAVAIFPEAALNPDGQPRKSATGTIRMSLKTRIPIIPVGFYVPPQFLNHIVRMKKGRKSQGHWQTHGHCYAHVGHPWLPCEEFDSEVDHESLTQLTEKLMRKIMDEAQLAMQAYTQETGQPAELASF
jgi:1-acyl-sn-glycerol-3-phosphate acyltransferase